MPRLTAVAARVVASIAEVAISARFRSASLCALEAASRFALIVTHNLHGWEMDVLNEAVQQARLR